MFESIVAIACLVVIILLFDIGFIFYKIKKRNLNSDNKYYKEHLSSKVLGKSKSKDSNSSQEKLSSCPVCLSKLQKGENLFTKLYGSEKQDDQRCVINGCPHCFPICKPNVVRECPVCGKNVSSKDGYLVARLFNKTKDGKKHVVVTGCNKCCNPFSK